MSNDELLETMLEYRKECKELRAKNRSLLVDIADLKEKLQEALRTQKSEGRFIRDMLGFTNHGYSQLLSRTPYKDRLSAWDWVTKNMRDAPCDLVYCEANSSYFCEIDEYIIVMKQSNKRDRKSVV